MRPTVEWLQREIANTQRTLIQLARIVNREIEFGNPADPDAANIRGSWAEGTFTAVDTATTFTHNLEIPTNSGGTPNVRWKKAMIRHDGVGASPGPLSIEFVDGDTVTTTTIQLTLRSAGTRTIDGTHPVTVSLFFIPAVS
jgi:hypothetical protein